MSAALYFSIVLLAKVFLASQLDLLGDEAYYWQASERQAFAYSDEPFVTALLVGLGTSVAGKNVLGVRLFFLVIGCATPVAVYLLAKPLVGDGDGIFAALASLTMPFGAVLGIFAVPDVVLVLLTVLGVAAFERATRTGRTTYWAALGLVSALGFSTHYRFVLFAAGALGYLSLTQKGRTFWKTPGPWVAALLALPGLVPAVLYNWQHDLVGLRFHFVSRHPWRFDASGFLHPFEQAAVVTPLLYAVLLLTLFFMIRDGWSDDRKALIACFCGAPLLAFWLVAPWAVRVGFTVHWPLPGYMPLFVFLPSTLRRLRDAAPKRLGSMLPFGTLASGACGVALLFVFLGAALVPERFSPSNFIPDVRKSLSGWSELGARTSALLAASGPERLLVANDYVVAAELDFLVDAVEGVYVLDASRGARHGRSYQTGLWRLDADSLSSRVGADALVVVEETKHDVEGRKAMIARLCGSFERLERLSRLNLYGGARRFVFYAVEDQRSEPRYPDPRTAALRRFQARTPCPLVVSNLDRPEAETEVDENVTVSGWAYADDVGIEAVEMWIDGVPTRGGIYGEPRPDVREHFTDSSDPNHPNVGFEAVLDTSGLAPGWHVLAVLVKPVGKSWETLQTRRFRVKGRVDS